MEQQQQEKEKGTERESKEESEEKEEAATSKGEDDEAVWTGDFNPLADPEERRVLFAALDSFRQYRRTAHLNSTHRRRQGFYALPSSHWEILAEPPFSLLDTFSLVDDAIDANADIADAIVAAGLAAFGLSAQPADGPRNWHGTATGSDVSKAHSTLRQFYRDWSAEGRRERAACYEPVLAFLRDEFDEDFVLRAKRRVLVPGAGLGRLVFELCRAGFITEGNEISYHQLLASSWVLNHTRGAEEHAIYPFALHFSNLISRDQQLQRIRIPDVHPGSAALDDSGTGRMSMTSGDFVSVYSRDMNREAFAAVATVFFIDTAPNLIRYIEAVHHCLSPDGIWINVGPLLWHFGGDDLRGADPGERSGDPEGDPHGSGIGGPGQVELTEEEVVQLVTQMGFKIERWERPTDETLTGYIQDPASMLQNLYRPSRWVARKSAQGLASQTLDDSQ